MDLSLAKLLYREYTRPYREFTVTTEDGVDIQGIHLDNGSDILLVFCHGLFSSKNQRNVPPFLESLSENFDVIAFDFRGHGGSTGHCTFGRAEIRDVKAVVDYARELGYPTIVAIGASMGGATVLRAFGQYGGLDGVATIGAFADTNLLQRPHTHLTLRFVFETEAGQALARWTRGTRIGDLLTMEQPVDFADRIDVPLLVIHGERDPLVEPVHAFQIMDHAPDPKELVILPQGGHVMTNLDDGLRDLIVGWVNSEVLPRAIHKQ